MDAGREPDLVQESLDGTGADVSGSRSITGCNILNNLDVTLLLVTRRLALRPVVVDSRLDGILGQHGAVQLDGWQAEFLGDLGVLDLGGLVEREALDTLGHVRRGSNGRSTTKSLEADILDDAVLVDLDRELHHITAGRSADETDTDVLLGLEERADVAWVLVVINDLFVVASSLNSGAKDVGRGGAGGGHSSWSCDSGEASSSASRGNGLPCERGNGVSQHGVC